MTESMIRKIFFSSATSDAKNLMLLCIQPYNRRSDSFGQGLGSEFTIMAMAAGGTTGPSLHPSINDSHMQQQDDALGVKSPMITKPSLENKFDQSSLPENVPKTNTCLDKSIDQPCINLLPSRINACIAYMKTDALIGKFMGI